MPRPLAPRDRPSLGGVATVVVLLGVGAAAAGLLPHGGGPAAAPSSTSPSASSPPSTPTATASSASASPSPSGPPGTLPLPQVGSVTAGILPDGTPVFVTRPAARDVRVVEAVSPVTQHGLGVELAWCPAGAALTDIVSGSTFDLRGRYVSGPAGRDLARYDARVVDGRVVAGARHVPAGRSSGTRRHVDCGFAPAVTPRRQLTFAALMSGRVAEHVADIGDRGGALFQGVLTLTRSGRWRVCDMFQGRSDCGTAGRRVVGIGPGLAGGRYPWVATRLFTGRVAGRAIRDLVEIPPGPAEHDPRERYGIVTWVGARTVGIDAVEFLTGDAADEAAAEDGADVPPVDDYYIRNPDPAVRTYRLTAATTYTIVDFEAALASKRVTYERWRRIVRLGDRLWRFRLASDGTLAAIDERFVP